MTTIRPNLYPQTQARPQGQDSAKLAAQRAFFDALSQARAPAQAQAPAASVSPATAQPAPAAVQRATATLTEAPQKILRPGSLLDIRI